MNVRFASLDLGTIGWVSLAACGLIFLIKLASPWIISFWQDTYRLTDPKILSLVHKRLQAAGLPELRVEVWPLKRFNAANALAVGMIYAPKVCRARILISDSLLGDFSAQEIDAVIAHEVSHFTQSHLSRRIWIPFFAYTFIVAGGLLALSAYPIDHWIPIATSENLFLITISLLVAVAYVICFSVLLRHLVRAQELDADWVAIHEFNVDSKLYFATLEKMLSYPHVASHAQLSQTMALSHPWPKQRQQLVLGDHQSKSPPFEKKLIRKLRATAMALILFFLLFSFMFRAAETGSMREPTSTQQAKP